MAEQEKAETSKQMEEAKGRKPNDLKSGEQTQSAVTDGAKENGGKEQDAITLLRNDHRAVEVLLSKLESASEDQEKITLAKQIVQDLLVLHILEDEIFFPAAGEHVDKNALYEAQVERDSSKFLLNELLSSSAEDDEFFDAKLNVLAEQLKQQKKRSDSISAKAKTAGLDIETLGRELAERKTNLKQQAERQSLGLPRPRSFRAFQQSSKEDYMPQSTYRERDSQGRFTSDDDNRRYSSRGRHSDRDDYGRYGRDDDDRRYSSRGRTPDRDENGRFVSDDDDRYSSRGSYGRSRDDDDDRNYSRLRNNASSGRSRDDDDRDYSRSRSSASYGRSRDDDDRNYSRDSRDNSDRGGWFGDSQGHSEASRRGWQNSDHEGSGWYGDSQGHSEASRRGWANREGYSSRSRYDDDDRGSRSYGSRNSYSRSRDDDDDRRGRGGERSQGGWFGDSEGHSEASRRGWENRR